MVLPMLGNAVNSATGNLGKALNLGLALTGNARAMLMPVGGGLPVMFTLNPKTVSMEKSNKTESERGVITSSFKDAVKATGNVRIKLKDAHLTGAVVTQMSIDKLIDWATPVQVTAAQAAQAGSATAFANLAASALTNRMSAGRSGGTPGGGSSALTKAMDSLKGAMNAPVYFRLPVLQFMWGIGGPAREGALVNLEKVDVEYQRFDGTGIPVWAKIGLTLVEYTTEMPGTNPTSGGLPGRSRHVVTQGEGVVQIATRTYGSPQAWRAVAEANGLDDPLRVKPGRALALPAPGEDS